MKFKDFKNFRDYDRKFVKVTNIDEKTKNALKIDKLEEPIYGILYIDRECGTSLRITGNELTKIEDTALIARADCFEKMNFELFDGNDFMEEVLEQINEGYYDEQLNELLKDKLLDEFRNEVFPNDVIAILPNEKQPEKMWVRLFMKTQEENLYVAELLDDSFFDKKYTTGKKVALIYYTEDNFKGLIINGLVKIQD